MSGMTFKRFGTQIDCSRNAVMNVDAVKRWIDLTAAMGHNTLLLYTEDTYEVDGHPYFGYGRGRFTKAELKELVTYGAEHGIELIPSINTLAHLGSIFRWKNYAQIHDCEDIMLCEDERTYELIDSMFRTLSECYTSKIVNVGMDEADMLGRGQYYNIHGDTKRVDILFRHLEKVSEIAKKYGKELLIYGDMFFHMATHTGYTDVTAKVVEDVSGRVPDNVSLVYWDYYDRPVEEYTALINVHKQIKSDNLWYYGGAQTWFTFAPHSTLAIDQLCKAIPACQNTGVENVIISTWGDDGGECGRFAPLASVFWATEVAKGNTDDADIKAKFEQLVGMPFDHFMLLDLTNLGQVESSCVQPTRYILYNDPFIGLMDKTIPHYTRADHEKLVEQLTPMCNHPKWGYLFENLRNLCAITAAKCDIGMRIRAAYEADDKQMLGELAEELRRIRRLVEKFYISFRRQWLLENKPQGFEVSDVRLGGVIMRLEHCAVRLEEYVRGELTCIAELEEEQLDIRTPLSDDYSQRKYLHYWDRPGRYYAYTVSAGWVGNGY